VNQDNQKLAEEYIRLALAIEEHMPGYVDAYFGPEEWQTESKQDGKLPLQNLTERTVQLANDISKADNMDAQRHADEFALVGWRKSIADGRGQCHL